MILEEMPSYTTAWKCLGETLLKLQKWPETEQLIQQMVVREETRIAGIILRARLAEQQGDVVQAREILQQLVNDASAELDALRELCRLLFERFSPADSLSALKQLTEQDAGDAAVFHNLGTTQPGMVKRMTLLVAEKPLEQALSACVMASVQSGREESSAGQACLWLQRSPISVNRSCWSSRELPCVIPPVVKLTSESS